MDKFTPTRIINAHGHHHPGELEEFAEQWQAQGLVATCLCGTSEDENRNILQARKTFGKFVVPFGFVNLDNDPPEMVDRLRDRGFVGLKFHCIGKPYSAPQYMPTFERAAKFNMPAVFHTGWGVGVECQRSLNMMPSELEPVGKLLPEWKFVIAHLGNWWARDGVGFIQHHPGAYADLSGGFIRVQSPSWLRSLFTRQPEKNLRVIDETVDYSLFEKLVFATDNPPLPELLEFYVNFLNWMNVPLDIQQRIYYGTMTDILGDALP